MPIYEYECNSCSRKTDIFAKMSELNVKRLCDCGEKMERRISVSNINGGTLSSASFQKYRTAFGRSVDSWSSVPDMDKHIKKKNKEFGLNIEPLGS